MRRFDPIPNRRDDERGVVAVWVALLLVVLVAFAGWAVDFSHWNDERTHMQKAADAAALAGAVYLPDDVSGAIATAKDIAAKNGYPSGVGVTILGAGLQLKVTINTSVKNSFAQVVGIGDTDLAKHSTAEFESPTPLDIVFIYDRTGSMATVPPGSPSGTQLPMENARDAMRDLLEFLNPKTESIALGVLPPSDTAAQCSGANVGARGKKATTDTGGPATSWMVAPYPLAKPANDYQLSDGTLNPNSQIVKTVNCLEAGGRTDLGDPIAAATSYLNTYGRPGSRRGIILMTDGAANEPKSSNQPCNYASGKATAAKAAGIQLLTIAFLSGSNACDPLDYEKSGPWVGVQVSKLLASMASPIKGVPAVANGCDDAENKDGDNFFCQPKGGDLSSVFLAAVAQLANRLPRIIQ